MSSASRQRRRRLVVLPLIMVLVIAAAWSGIWFYAAHRAEAALAGWRERGASAGRNFSCGKGAIGGYPFRIELSCREPAADLASNDPPVMLKASDFQVVAQIYDPTLLIAEIGAPLTVTVAGAAPVHAAWTLAQVSLRGKPSAPERASLLVQGASIGGPASADADNNLRAKRIETHVRIASGSANRQPVVDLTIELSGAEVPALRPLAAEPFDLSTAAVLRGLDNLRPLSIPARLKQLQSAGGRLDITSLRLRQGEMLAIADGSLGLTANGRLDGNLNVTIAGFGAIMSKLVAQIGPAALNQASAGLSVALGLIGRQTELEGRRALSVRLRFDAGVMYVGPLRVGELRPLF